MAAPLLIAALAALLQVPEEKSGRWETFTSAEGRFSVDFPSKPNQSSRQTRSSAGGSEQVITTGFRGAGGNYFVYKFEFPTTILRGLEETQLDAERDGFVRQFHGKVIAEKKIQLDGYAGRDFTIRGEPERGVGLVTTRARMYVAGNAVYALLAVSAPNRELAEDAGRFLGSLKIGLPPNAATPLKPAREEWKQKEIKGWGTAIDPSGDCTIESDGKTLTIKVPGTLHDLNAQNDSVNAPRVLRDVTGDFSVQVKVVGTFKPTGTKTSAATVPYNGAGILLWAGEGHFVRFERAAMLRDGSVTTFLNFEKHHREQPPIHRGAFIEAGPVYLRLTRKQNQIVRAVSRDGVEWQAFEPLTVDWPARVKVGVAAVNSNSAAFPVRFEKFSVEN
jgi:regulation of enolase protein 1 (concanavalin A-like superfamily)